MRDGDVSRETYDAFGYYIALLEKWNARINLIARSTSSEIWNRHILDSFQLVQFADKGYRWLDLGSGAGFPGIVVSVARPDVPMTLIESDNRKAAFLREVVRQLRLDCTVIADRIERIEPQNAAIISARALAPLSELLGLAARHATPETVYLLPKGRDWEMEVVKARGMWQFDMETFPSQTDAQGRILKLRSVRRVASESGS